MCQDCVKDGYLTQEELDRRIAAGDRDVIPIDELSLQEFMDALSALTAKAVLDGVDPVVALGLATADLDRYVAGREAQGRPVTEAESAALVDPYTKRMAEKIKEAAPWN
jgi:hypothetical protein